MKLMRKSELIRSIRGQIVDQLRTEVLCGRLEPGRYLRQEDLVARFRVSRTPVREALIHLIQEGLLEAVPNAGVKVRRHPPNHIQAFLSPLRRTIEVYALELCFDDLSVDDFAIWDDILGSLWKACRDRDYSAIAEHEIAFHRSVLCRAGDPTLLKIWGLILSQVAAFFHESHRTYEDPMEIHREHEEIVATFRSRNKSASLSLYSGRIGALAPVQEATRKSRRNVPFVNIK